MLNVNGKDALFFDNLWKPENAVVGKLYELRFTAIDVPLDDLQFYTFDTKGQSTNFFWTPEELNYCLVLAQEPKYTTVLVGDRIIHIANTGHGWTSELIPLIDQSNSQET